MYGKIELLFHQFRISNFPIIIIIKKIKIITISFISSLIITIININNNNNTNNHNPMGLAFLFSKKSLDENDENVYSILEIDPK